MIDFIVIVAPIEHFNTFNSFNPFEWKGLKFYPKFKKGNLKGFESEYKGLRVILYYNKIQISNSLHKFYKGNNYSDFTHSELTNAIQEICQIFEIKAKCWEIKKLEFGFNILTLKPAKEYIALFLEYKERKFEKMKHKQTDYGRKCFLYEYALKVYDKSLQCKAMDSMRISDKTLRVEFCYNQKRKLPKLIETLADLMDKDKFKELFRDLNEAFAKVIYNDEVDFTNSTNEERILFYASLNPDFIKVEEQINKTEAKAIRLKIKQLKERFFKKEFKKWFLKALSDKYIELYCC
ncbi:hypothetical protein JSO54_03685 [Riemerella anatipestifer]|uniref:hypothetical protein n=1 Tax=Riemerella anatipestifer TaxID=34085 RepID=UPI0030C151B0